jgi:hypothetical protein
MINQEKYALISKIHTKEVRKVTAIGHFQFSFNSALSEKKGVNGTQNAY